MLSIQNLIKDAAWCILGDFNECLKPNESSNTNALLGMFEFRDFTMQSGISDLKSTGQSFTWWDSCLSNPLFKKLDRCLVNDI